jgi:hypothetical protein
MTAPVLDLALSYIERGWNPVPIPARQKGPTDTGWQQRHIDAASAPRYFNGEQNIGIILGPTSRGLTDIDLDCAEAIAIAPYILPRTNAIFGRASKRASHWLYYTDLALTSETAAIKFKNPIKDPDGKQRMLVELRIGGNSGAQTVFPGSTHETGEAIQWEEEGEPLSVDADELHRKVHEVAAFALLACHWPHNGSHLRHQAALVIGGLLARAGKSASTIKAIAEAIAKAAGDEEWKDRRTAAQDAAEAYSTGKHAFGLPAMRELFGVDVTNKVAEWLDHHAKDDTTPRSKPACTPWRYHDDAPAEPTSWLIKGLLPETGVGLLSGQWGTFKTTVALDLSTSAISGAPFAGQFPVKRRGGVVYIAVEGASGLKSRFDAAARERGVPGALPFAWRSDCPALIAPDALDQLTRLMEEPARYLKQQFNADIVLIWIDTIIAAAGYAKPGEDNDTAIAQRVMSVLAGLSQRTSALVLGVDHFGKIVDTGTRGSSAKEGHADIVLAALADRELSGAVVNTRLALRKLREGQTGLEIPFTAKPIEVGTDPDGDPITRVVIDWNPPQASATNANWSKSLLLLRRVLMNLLADVGVDITPFIDGPTVRAVDIGIVRTEFYKRYAADGDTKQKADARRMAFNRAIKDATAKNLIVTRECGNVQYVWLANPLAP